MDGIWAVNIHGGRKSGFEISVVHSSFPHGRASWGWPGKQKIIISRVDEPGNIDKPLWEDLVALAKATALRLNQSTAPHSAPTSDTPSHTPGDLTQRP